MDKKISFFILSTTGSPIKRLTMSKGALKVLSLVLMFALVASGYVVYDYYTLKKLLPSTSRLKSKIDIQEDEIVNQRQQIQNFANEINILKTKLIDLNRFEKKIRIIANIEKTSGQDGLFGVGGSIPEDLNPNIELESKHNRLLRDMHEQVEQLNVASVSQKDGFESLLKFLDDQRNLLASTPAISPVNGWVTSRFGYRSSPFTGRREFHKGLDIAALKKSPIIATADGVVTFVGLKGMLGKVVVLDHGHGISTQYGHIDKALKKPGEKITRGDEIALVGNSGRTTGSHVHYEVLLNGLPVNPEKYIID
ncbi:MAG: M23 family metallopeptidase [Desulfobacterales bacterium]|nr:M23 family metallopeptidase [Desulfobacterales bacterium]